MADLSQTAIDPSQYFTGPATANPMLMRQGVAMRRAWDTTSAARAKELEKAGTKPQIIWQETGTWKGPDGKWRQEISNTPVFENYQDAMQPAFGNPNLAAKGRRYNLAERQQISPRMQAANVQFEKEKSSLSDRGAVTDLINKGFIAGLGGLPVDLINMGLTPLGMGSAFPFGGSEHIKRVMEYYGVATPTERPMMEGIASLTPLRAVMGAARVAGQGAEAVGMAAAPVAGKALENYMGRTGMQLNAVPEPPTLKAGKSELMPTEYKSATSIEPPHNVRDTKKLFSLTESMKNTGWQGRPILTYDVGRGEEALTGSHRIKAARDANIEVPIYRIENAGDYVDKNGKSILDVGFMELDDQVKWLNKFGDKNAAKLLKQEPEF